LEAMGKTVVLTTPYMEEAEKLSDRVAIFDQGRVIALDTPANLIRSLERERAVDLGLAGGEEAGRRLMEEAGTMPFVSRCEWTGDRLRVWSGHPETSLYHLLRTAVDRQLDVAHISFVERNLEDVYFAYTGKEWRD